MVVKSSTVQSNCAAPDDALVEFFVGGVLAVIAQSTADLNDE
jgi:hypothetical protein